MTKAKESVASDIVAGAKEFLDAVQRGKRLDETFTVRTVEFDPGPSAYGAKAVREVRRLLHMSQAIFAQFLGVTRSTVRAWEQGLRPPKPIARRFMDEIRIVPEYWRSRARQMIKRKDNATT